MNKSYASLLVNVYLLVYFVDGLYKNYALRVLSSHLSSKKIKQEQVAFNETKETDARRLPLRFTYSKREYEHLPKRFWVTSIYKRNERRRRRKTSTIEV